MIKKNESLAETLPPLTARSRNLVRFSRHLPVDTMDESFAGDFAFRDAGSRFSLLKSPKTAPGPDECYGLFLRDTRVLFRKLLGMNLVYEGLDAGRQAAIADYNAMNYYRSHVVEYVCHNGISPMPPVEGECVFWFAAADLLCIRYRLVNKSAVDVPVRLAWFSEGEAGKGFALTPSAEGFGFENTQTVPPHTYVSRAELRAQEADVRFAPAEGTVTRSAPVARVIPANGSVTCRFAVRFAFNDEPLPAWPGDLWGDASLEEAIAQAETAYERIPGLPAEFRCHQDLTLKAAGTLRSLRYRDYDSLRQPRMSIHAGKTGCGATWFWDTGTTLPALGLMREREAADGALRILTQGIKADGTPPVTYENQEYLYSYQIPLVTWGTGHFLAASPDARLLADVYAPLARYVRHWMERYITPRGLVAYPPGMTSLDDALRWNTGFPLEPRPGKPWYENKWGHMRQDLFASPDINAFLVLELRTLAAMAASLGKPAEAASWLRQADGLAAAINDWLIEPRTCTYQDRHLETGAFTDMITLGSFLPIYAGIAPAETAGRSCRDYLLSPEHFLTPFPFPVIDRAHPTFRSGGFLHAPPAYPGSLVQHSYWRGRTWIHGNTWYLGALWQSGFTREADENADRILTAVSRNEGIHECYDSLTGFGNGHPEFMWSAASVLLVAHQFYKQNPVATLPPNGGKA
jgi:hypothetical protein